jgi:hypothetical protein
MKYPKTNISRSSKTDSEKIYREYPEYLLNDMFKREDGGKKAKL